MKLHRLVAVFLLSAAAGAYAADSGPVAAADPLAAARTQIAAKQWGKAIEELKKINARENADWNNLMGYSLRKQATPDLEASERYYNEALRIDPKHRGALEYSGELMLMKNDLPGAKAKLSSLQAVCGASCAETEKLKTAIAGYEAGKPRTP
jgi:tetratricopeptide (TPR) repeat protein